MEKYLLKTLTMRKMGGYINIKVGGGRRLQRTGHFIAMKGGGQFFGKK